MGNKFGKHLSPDMRTPMPRPETVSHVATAANPDRRAARSLDLRAALAFALAAFLIYNANWRLITASDNYPARYLPFAIIGHGTLRIDPIRSVASQGRAAPYWIIRGTNNHLVSFYPVVAPLLASPLYLPAIAWLDVRGWTDSRVDRLARFMEKISASLIVSLSVGLMYLLLRRRAGVPIAVLLTIAYAFGTNTWVTSSQGMWQHGTAELLLVTLLLLATGRITLPRAIAAGAVCALIVFNRPPDAILAAPLGLYALWRAGRSAPWIVAGGIVAGIPFLVYNICVVGYLLGGYALVENPGFFRFSLPFGVAGLLFSLGRGLLVFTPFLLAVPYGLPRILRERPGRGLSIMICIASVLQVMLYAKADWRGGASWGPRYLTDVIPLLVWMLPPVVASLGRFTRAIFCSGVCASIAIQVVGAFWFTGKSDELLLRPALDDSAMRAFWNLRSTPFIFELRHRPAPRDLLLKMEGGVDSIEVGGVPVSQAPSGATLAVRGWALVNGHRKPWRALADLVPAAAPAAHPTIGVTLDFHPRPGPPGTDGATVYDWTLTLPSAGLPPGNYVIETSAQGNDGGEGHPLATLPFKLLPAEKQMETPR